MTTLKSELRTLRLAGATYPCFIVVQYLISFLLINLKIINFSHVYIMSDAQTSKICTASLTLHTPNNPPKGSSIVNYSSKLKQDRGIGNSDLLSFYKIFIKFYFIKKSIIRTSIKIYLYRKLSNQYI